MFFATFLLMIAATHLSIRSDGYEFVNPTKWG